MSSPLKMEMIYLWSEWSRENISSFTCAKDQVMVGREHGGDENGNTRYCVTSLVFDDRVVRVECLNWSSGQKESNGDFEAGKDEVLVGREHDGDENGNTRYLTAKLTWAGQPVALGPTQKSPSFRESDHSFRAPEGCVLVGRRHSSDENGPTEYLYAQVLPPI